MKPQAEHHIPLLVLTCFAIFFVNLNTLDPNIMEARNFTTAREMLHDGNWLLTTLNGAPRYQKPPLPTWLTAVSGAVFGLKNLWALRLPAALAALLLVLFSYKFLVKLTKNKPFAFIGALVLATSFYVVFAGRNGQWDIFTHAFMMAAIYYLFRFFKLGRDGPNFKKNRFVFALWAGLFFGLSFMSKGPVSVYALLLPFLIAFAVVYKPKGFRGKRLPLFVFTVAAIGISSWWYGYTYFYDTAGAAITAQRETANWTNYNVRPFYYYWSFFTQSGVWAIMAFIGLLYPYLKTRVFHKKAYTFTVLWVLASVVLLSVIPEKKSRYLLPVLIPLAFSTAFYIEYLFRGFSTLKATWETWPVYFNFGLVALIGIVFPLGGYLYLGENLHGHWSWFVALSVALFVLGVYMLKGLFQKNIKKVFYATLVFIAGVVCFGMPLSAAISVNPKFKSLSKLALWQTENPMPIYEFGTFTPELVWAFGKPLPSIFEGGQLQLPDEETFGVLVSGHELGQFKKTFVHFNIKKTARYDMNRKPVGDRAHKTRLWRDFFVVVTNRTWSE